MLQACSQGVDLKVDRHFGEIQAKASRVNTIWLLSTYLSQIAPNFSVPRAGQKPNYIPGLRQCLLVQHKVADHHSASGPCERWRDGRRGGEKTCRKSGHGECVA